MLQPAPELQVFETLCQALGRRFQLEKRGEFAYVIHPSVVNPPISSKKIALTLMALTHGNEVGGLGVLCEILKQILSGVVELRQPLAVVLGNPEAFLAGKRFLERDLNRSFGSEEKGSTLEGRRSEVLAPLLADTFFLMDFHQTLEPTQTPFYIFPYRDESAVFAGSIDPMIPIVTRREASFSQDGMGTDEFVNSQGGVGISVELGQKGPDPEQKALGFLISLRSIAIVNSYPKDLIRPEDVANTFFSMDVTIPYPDAQKVELERGLCNFQEVYKGMPLGLVDGESLYAPESGLLLFPKYVQPGDPQPAELLRLVKKSNLEFFRSAL